MRHDLAQHRSRNRRRFAADDRSLEVRAAAQKTLAMIVEKRPDLASAALRPVKTSDAESEKALVHATATLRQIGNAAWLFTESEGIV